MTTTSSGSTHAAMLCGLYCTDAELLPFVERLSDSSPSLTWLAAPTAELASLRERRPHIEVCAEWEQLLIARSLAAIVVGGSDEPSLSIFRQLVATDAPLWVRLGPAQGIGLAYEFSLANTNRPQPIHPLWPHRSDPVLQALDADLQTRGVQVTHLEIDRTFAFSPADNFDREWQRRRLDDLDLLHWFGLRAMRVTALPAPRPDPRQRRLSVSLESEAGCSAVWNAETHPHLPADTGLPTSPGTGNSVRLTLQTTDGMLQLHQSGSGPWRRSDESSQLLATQQDEPQFKLVGPGATLIPLPWEDAVTVWEWEDAISRSLARRRAIEIHSDPLSERMVFKSQMAAMGCAVLMATLGLSLIYLIVAAAVPLPPSLLQAMRFLIFAPLFLFLLVQLLLPLARTAGRTDRRGDPKSGRQ